ncbi:hypothetical protein CK203_003269 [Vitis vinifera]|uniref:SWIM-type domain-containing protein n=1 Tax=Vitis vinifera TaxID=29760 RepID=A0A438K761_VITVI|nr:hypothetical protein CK203_003269 [Vitis vinifera]
MDLENSIYGYLHEGGEIVPKEDKQIQYNGGQQKGMYIGQRMSYAEFVSKACERLNINSNGYTFHYTLEFDPSTLQQLDDDEDMHMMLSHSYDYARIYVLKRTRRVEVEGDVECSSQPSMRERRGARVIEQVIRATPQYLPRQICKDFRSQYGVSLSYKQAWTYKEMAKERIYGLPENSYMLLPWLCQRLVDINPGTIVEYSRQDGNFWQLFIAHSFSIQGFLMGCRPVITIDSTHLSGPYRGSLFSAIAYDADDGMFPIAFGVVSLENYEDWLWFLQKLLDDDYVVAMEKLKTYNSDLAKWVEENSPQHWAMSKFAKKRWDKMTTNLAESFNAWLKEERHYTIFNLVFDMKVYVDMNLRERTCTCKAWQMAGIPCEHACAAIRQMKQDVYEYVDSYFKLPMQELIYSGHFNSIPNHNMPIVDADGCVRDAQRSLISFT